MGDKGRTAAGGAGYPGPQGSAPHGHEHEHEHGHEHGHEHEHENEHDHENEHEHGLGAPHSHVHTHQQTRAVLNRLSRISGHLGAVRRMVEDGRDCPEVLIQLAAVRSAIDGVCKLILKDHLDNCIMDAVETGDSSAIAELNRAIEILMK